MVTCGYCGHPGVHATILPPDSGTKRCTGCAQCAADAAAEQTSPLASRHPGDRQPDSSHGIGVSAIRDVADSGAVPLDDDELD
jgi:hypothetical protein